MKIIDPRRMAEATRLTRSGRLGEATALIQKMLGGKPAPAAPSDGWAGPTLDLRAEPETAARPRSERARQSQPEPARDPAPRPVADAAAGQLLPSAWAAHTYANPFGRRAYKLYLPERRAGVALPLVVMLHGCTQKPDDFATGTRLNRAGRGAGLHRGLSGPDADGQRVALLELVSADGPGARAGRAVADRRHRAGGHRRARRRSGACLCCRALGRWCRGSADGQGLSRSLRGGGRPFRPRAGCGERCRLGAGGDAGARGRCGGGWPRAVPWCRPSSFTARPTRP